MYRINENLVFSRGPISEVFQKSYNAIESTIGNETENYIFNANEISYAEYLQGKYSLDLPELHFDQVNADSYEADIPAEYFPSSFYVHEGKSYKKEIIQFFIPCSGDVKLLFYGPANLISISGGGRFEIKGDSIVAEFINFSNNANEINQKYQDELRKVQSMYGYLKNDIVTFNNSLNSYIQSIFSQRKQRFLNKNNLLCSLGIPLRSKGNVPETFSIPKPQLRERIVVKPIVHENGFKPEPTLDNENYQRILKIINDVGRNFERLPSIYKGKGEEDLRDHMLMVLDPNFEFGSASGETFNKSGKTDIQLRYDSSVVFIAECKFWSGTKNHASTIDQLLRYLTWRDNKASVIVFVKQNDFTSILAKIEMETMNHPNYLSFVGKTDENWFNYRFHLNGDRNRELQLAVQVYSIPTI